MDEPIWDKTILEPDVEAALNEMLAEIRRLNVKIAENQREIDRMKAETRRLGEQTRAILAEIEATF
jgi:uncharacterized coiled-coil protein SlyX